jgi:predicted ArsR family transcriptional regulator
VEFSGTSAAAAPVTRTRVIQVLAEHGQATVPGLATELGLTQAAVRRHLDGLQADGLVEPAAHPRPTRRGRGRPARTFSLSEAGRSVLPGAYDELAVAALAFLSRTGGDDAVHEFARTRLAALSTTYPTTCDDASALDRATALAKVLTDQGYVASAEAAPGGAQVCQHHCPVAHVAEQFPALCEAETEAFAEVLGTHVQRLATIARGDGVCTTFVPDSSPSTAASPVARPPERTPA